MAAPKIKVIYQLAGDLVPYVNNARTHSDEQVSQIAASIKEFGFTNPILTDGDSGIIAGHGRLLAALRLKMKEVPTIELSELSEAQKKAYILADNKLAMNAGWDNDLLAVELEGLDDLGFDLDLTGFDELEISQIRTAEATEEELARAEETPETPDDPISVEGDLWVLGNHRIICGDSTDADVVEKVLKGVKPHLMVTDPPYGVEYDAEWRAKSGVNAPTAAHGKVLNDDNADWREAWALFPGEVAYVWHAGLHARSVVESLEASDFNIRSQIIWAKSTLVMGRGDYHYQHEPCWYAVRKSKAGHYCGGRKQTTLWQIDKPQKSETGHSTQKPIECMRRPIVNNSSMGQAVYEPFSGSGTTIIAGEMTGRHIYAIELSPAYVDVAVNRWQNFTGQEAVHAETGKKFNEMKHTTKESEVA